MSNFLAAFKDKIETILPSMVGKIEPNFNQSPTLPRACYFVVNAEPIDACLDGTHGDRDHDFQLDIFSDDGDQAWDMVELCRTSLENTVLEVWGDFTVVDIFDCKSLNNGAETSSNGSNQTIYHATLLLTVTVRRN